ncbi:Zn-ribbon domain-containing OB-fold protein [Sinomonas atrocyanea]
MSTAAPAIGVLACASCSAAHLEAPNGRCPSCGSGDLAPIAVEGTGRVASATTVRLAPPGVAVPYVIAYADFEPGARLLGRCDSPLRIGDTVTLVPADDPVERFRFIPEEARP